MEGVDICTGCLSATENEAFQHWRGYRDAAAGVGRLQLHWFRELERLLDQRRKNIRTIQSALRKEAA
jgi:hypothetical protein